VLLEKQELRELARAAQARVAGLELEGAPTAMNANADADAGVEKDRAALKDEVQQLRLRRSLLEEELNTERAMIAELKCVRVSCRVVQLLPRHTTRHDTTHTGSTA